MKLLLSNLFSVMAASSFVSSANALSLADYAAMTIGPIDATTGDGGLTDACEVDTENNPGTVTLACGFNYQTDGDGSTLVGSKIVAKIFDGACGAVEDNAGVTVDKIAVAAVLPDDSTGTVEDGAGTSTDVTDSFDMVISNDQKNTEKLGLGESVIVQKYCARADVWDSDKSVGSVLAYMMEVTTTTTFDVRGTFSTSVETTEFTAADAAAAAERQVGVSSAFGACNSGASASAVAIGSVLDICVSIAEEDTDVTINTIRDVTIKDAADETLLTTPISAVGAINFVTTLEPDVNAENAVSAYEVTISTLMIPKIYDELKTAGTSITIAGTADFEYVRRLSSGERRLQSEEAPFSLKVDLTKNDLPQVAMNEEESGAMSAGVGMMALAAGVAALL